MIRPKLNLKTRTSPSKTRPAPSASSYTAPFVEHLYELRRRLFYIAVSVFFWSAAAYAIQQHIVSVLLRPSHGQSFVYTSPIGGIDFLFRVCLYTGLIISLPVIVYQLLRFTAPLMKTESTRFIAWGSAISGLVAVLGIVFGYFIGLPTALHFLLHQFQTSQIKPLITVQSYMSFVMVYMVGSALMFQVPLFLIFINRIKPLKPSRLFHYERWVILIAFVMAGLMNPTPKVWDQLLVAGPIILMYQLGIGIIALINRPRWPAHVRELFDADLQAQAERLERAQSLQKLS
jgi:sec-independent protein translocase protein TatC